MENIICPNSQKFSSYVYNCYSARSTLYVHLAGAAVVVAQFPIRQFRMIGWTNASVGVAALLIQVVIFHEQSWCEKVVRPNTIKFHHCTDHKTKTKIYWMGLFVSYLCIAAVCLNVYS